MIASRKGHKEVVSYLIAQGADVNLASEDNWTPLMRAANNNHVEVVKALVQADAALDVQLYPSSYYAGQTALHFACAYGFTDVAKTLILAGANTHIKDTSNQTPLDLTDTKTRTQLEPLIQEYKSMTPLHIACRKGKKNQVKTLIEANVDLDTKTRNGLTPLHLACEHGHATVVKLLIQAGAQTEITNALGVTCLHDTCHYRQVEMVLALLENGVNVNVEAFVPLQWVR
jgi:ankyrin repeat protein